MLIWNARAFLKYGISGGIKKKFGQQIASNRVTLFRVADSVPATGSDSMNNDQRSKVNKGRREGGRVTGRFWPPADSELRFGAYNTP